ncbi:YIPF6 [Bugula neritina]|uniref:Protein YIPF n=1 Tax=Bugula neritina TaxID=10212 RepID=A0A7J7JCU1_BUGNE|nr:YIPF6 [Bugula neritina]
MAETTLDMPEVDTTEISLDGDMEIPSSEKLDPTDGQPSTLDEPVSTTIKRDLKMIGEKFFHVLVPRQSSKLLKDWDLWGPLVLCMFMAMMLQNKQSLEDMKSKDGGPEFATFFVIYWAGALIITINTILLGGSISIFQCMCVLGYCVVPLAVALTLCKVILLVDADSTGLFVVRSIIVLIALAWSIFASTAFLVESQPMKRKILVLYPIGLFYFVISWLVISHKG